MHIVMVSLLCIVIPRQETIYMTLVLNYKQSKQALFSCTCIESQRPYRHCLYLQLKVNSQRFIILLEHWYTSTTSLLQGFSLNRGIKYINVSTFIFCNRIFPNKTESIQKCLKFCSSNTYGYFVKLFGSSTYLSIVVLLVLCTYSREYIGCTRK